MFSVVHSVNHNIENKVFCTLKYHRLPKLDESITHTIKQQLMNIQNYYVSFCSTLQWFNFDKN